jgi:hypothetical protein
VAEILAYLFAEVLINFMVNPVQRFLSSARQAGNWDALFGTPDWRKIRDESSQEHRTQRIVLVAPERAREEDRALMMA